MKAAGMIVRCGSSLIQLAQEKPGFGHERAEPARDTSAASNRKPA